MTATLTHSVETPDDSLASRARAGDDHAWSDLLRRYGPRVRRLASRYFLHAGDRDDLIQEGMIGLYKAVCDFDAGRGVPFGPFADMCVKRQLISAVRAATRLKHAMLADAMELTEHAEAACLAELSIDPARVVLARETLGELKGFLDGELSSLERGALWLHLDGLSLKESAARLSTRAKAVDNALQRARRKMHVWADLVVAGARTDRAAVEAA